MTRYVRFADLTIRMNLPEEIPLPCNMQVFEIRDVERWDYEYSISILDSIDLNSSAELKSIAERWVDAQQDARKTILVFTKDGLECRWIFFEGANRPYGICEEVSGRESHVYIFRDQLEMMQYDTIFASLFSLERRMLDQNAILLHCAYMVRDGEAILFSAPSGTGKTTQAELWERYRGTRQVNGDAALLTTKNGRWMANGWCVCGSSGICHNESYPIRAIVMLFQSEVNTCRQLSGMGAFRQVYPQIKVNSWNTAMQDQALERIEQLIAEVTVLELGCEISEAAVACLEDALP